MNALAVAFLIALILSAFIYLAVIIPVEMFKRRLATVAFKRGVYALSLLASCVLTFGGYGLARLSGLAAPSSATLLPASSPTVIEGAHWNVRCEPLGQAHRACHGPGTTSGGQERVGPPTHYVVSVERLGPDGALELYSERVPIAEVAPEVLGPEVAEVVAFDAASREVTFDLGQRTVRFVLPGEGG